MGRLNRSFSSLVHYGKLAPSKGRLVFLLGLRQALGAGCHNLSGILIPHSTLHIPQITSPSSFLLRPSSRRGLAPHLLQQPLLPLIPLLLEPEVPGGLVGRDGLWTLHGVIGCPCRGGRHHIIIVSEREPTLLLIRDQPCEVDTVIIARHLDSLLLTPFLWVGSRPFCCPYT